MKDSTSKDAPVDFDDHSETYEPEVQRAIGFSGRKHDFFLDAKAEIIIELCRRRLAGTESLAALDVGCGVGLLANRLVGSFKALHGVDPSEQSIRAARTLVPGAHLQTYDGEHLPYSESTFDVVLSTLVFHHVPEILWQSLLVEMKRVARPDGLVIVIEHNPWNPLTRLVVNRCTFDRDAVLLSLPTLRKLFAAAGLRDLERRFFLFFPWQVRASTAAARLLAGIPLGAQYLVAASK
jgi:SAM-dependent methyltransferase